MLAEIESRILALATLLKLVLLFLQFGPFIPFSSPSQLSLVINRLQLRPCFVDCNVSSAPSLP